MELDQRASLLSGRLPLELSRRSKEPHGTLGGRLTAADGAKEMQGRGRSRMEQRQQGVMRQTQAGLPRTACRRHAGRRWRRIIVACRQGRELSGRRSREHSKASDKDAGRQNKLQSLPLTRIAGRDSPKPLCIADLSARRQGKSLLRISRRTRTCRPMSGLCLLVVSLALASRSGEICGADPPIRSRPPALGSKPLQPSSLGVRESVAGCGGLRVSAVL